VRRLSHPDYEAEMIDSDVRLTFRTPSSRFGPVEVVLTADDAHELSRAIDKAVTASDALLEAERAE
jgi:hypothetical protein